MIVYLDASALVKRYVAEPGSAEVELLIESAEALATSVVSRAEVAAALAKAARLGIATRESAAKALQLFGADWSHLMRLEVAEPLIARAAALAWEHGLRGYDAVHLACALVWREALAAPVMVATYDRELWHSARATGLVAWPAKLP